MSNNLEYIKRKLVKFYCKLMQRTFTGYYRGQEVMRTGKIRYKVEVHRSDPLYPILQSVRDEVGYLESDEKVRVWKGFTGNCENVFHDTWNPMIFTPVTVPGRCNLTDKYAFKIVNFAVRTFEGLEYDVEIDIDAEYMGQAAH